MKKMGCSPEEKKNIKESNFTVSFLLLQPTLGQPSCMNRIKFQKGQDQSFPCCCKLLVNDSQSSKINFLTSKSNTETTAKIISMQEIQKRFTFFPKGEPEILTHISKKLSLVTILKLFDILLSLRIKTTQVQSLIIVVTNY